MPPRKLFILSTCGRHFPPLEEGTKLSMSLRRRDADRKGWMVAVFRGELARDDPRRVDLSLSMTSS